MTGSKASGHWHLPRPEVAQRIVSPFENGVAPWIVLQGDPQIGKTEFLQRDITPLAEAAGFRVVYVCFQGSNESVGACLMQAVSVDTPTEVPTMAVSRALRQLIDGDQDGPVLFLFDDVDCWVGNETSEPYLYTLRTVLDEYKGGAYAVFCGSSTYALDALFRRHTAPLFGVGARLTLDPLGEDYVRHLVAQVQPGADYDIDVDQAIEAFHRLGCAPGRFEALLNRVLAEQCSVGEALHRYPLDYPKDSGH